MLYIVICFIIGIIILIVEFFSIIATNFYDLGYGIISILLHISVISIGLLFTITAIKDYRKLKKGDTKSTTLNETDDEETKNKE